MSLGVVYGRPGLAKAPSSGFCFWHGGGGPAPWHDVAEAAPHRYRHVVEQSHALLGTGELSQIDAHLNRRLVHHYVQSAPAGAMYAVWNIIEDALPGEVLPNSHWEIIECQMLRESAPDAVRDVVKM